jgi:hypothetical protein
MSAHVVSLPTYLRAQINANEPEPSPFRVHASTKGRRTDERAPVEGPRAWQLPMGSEAEECRED